MKTNYTNNKTNNKKAQSMPLNIVIIAVILLVVVVVVLAIFTRESGQIVKRIERCEQNAGECIKREDSCSNPAPNLKCDNGEVCCLDVGEFV